MALSGGELCLIARLIIWSRLNGFDFTAETERASRPCSRRSPKSSYRASTLRRASFCSRKSRILFALQKRSTATCLCWITSSGETRSCSLPTSATAVGRADFAQVARPTLTLERGAALTAAVESNSVAETARIVRTLELEDRRHDVVQAKLLALRRSGTRGKAARDEEIKAEAAVQEAEDRRVPLATSPLPTVLTVLPVQARSCRDRRRRGMRCTRQRYAAGKSDDPRPPRA